jgi:hypothetical protein
MAAPPSSGATEDEQQVGEDGAEEGELHDLRARCRPPRLLPGPQEIFSIGNLHTVHSF